MFSSSPVCHPGPPKPPSFFPEPGVGAPTLGYRFTAGYGGWSAADPVHRMMPSFTRHRTEDNLPLRAGARVAIGFPGRRRSGSGSAGRPRPGSRAQRSTAVQDGVRYSRQQIAEKGAEGDGRIGGLSHTLGGEGHLELPGRILLQPLRQNAKRVPPEAESIQRVEDAGGLEGVSHRRNLRRREGTLDQQVGHGVI